MTQQEIIGRGSLSGLSEVVGRLDPERVLLVIDEQAYTASGASVLVDNILKDRASVRFSDFEPNPRLESIERGLAVFRNQPCDAVIALGGGTAIDTAKLIGVAAASDVSCRELVDHPDRLTDRLPLVAIPTTAGTGSEATHFAVVYIDGLKHSIAHPLVRPDIAIVDPDLTHNLPPSITAHTGLDALCQAVESLWSVRSTAASRRMASHALALSSSNIETVVKVPTAEARSAMSEAAHFAGKAINISFTTGAHAVSYKLTSDFDVPHGLAVALTLGGWMRYNDAVTGRDCLDPRGVDHVRTSLGTIARGLDAGSMRGAADRLDALLRSIECPNRLSEVGVGPDDLDSLVESVNAHRLSNNPRRVTPESLRQLLNESL